MTVAAAGGGGAATGGTGPLRLHLNELRPVPRSLVRALARELRGIDPSLYPDADEEEAVRQAVAEYAGWDPARVLYASGSDPLILAIAVAARLYLRRVVVPWPTFAPYADAPARLGVAVEKVPLGPGFALPLEELLRRAGPEDAVVLVRPNNPTGNVYPAEAVLRLHEAGVGLLVLDEAYAEFAGCSLAPSFRGRPRVVIVRTMSKAFGLAGMRFGYLLASPDWAPRLRDLLPPYAVGRHTLAAVRLLLARAPAHVAQVAAGVARRRERLLRRLAALPGLVPFPSEANFILVRVGPPAPAAPELAARLRAAGVAVRWFEPESGLADCIRVTVGGERDHAALLRALRELIPARPRAGRGRAGRGRLASGGERR